MTQFPKEYFTNQGRNKERIPVILDKLRIVWENNPDMRFFQLLNAIGFDSHQDHFYCEDIELNDVLDQYIGMKR